MNKTSGETPPATILIVDDTPEDLHILRQLLKDQGYRVHSTSDGTRALKFAYATPPDLILLDIRMPEINGYQVCAQLKADARTRAIPVFFISVLGEIQDKVKGFEAGGVDYLAKPFQRAEVLARVKAHVAIQQLQRALHAKNQELQRTNQELHDALGRERALLERERKLTDDLRVNLSLSLPHELRTPLNAILGFSTLLINPRKELTPDKIMQYGKHIYNSGHRLLHLVQNALVYAKLHFIKYASKESRTIPRTETCDAKKIAETIACQHAECVHRHADLVLDLRHVALRISPANFAKILTELLDNAFKFSKSGTPVHVTTRIADNQCVLRITDQGCGMTQEQIAAIGAYMQFDRSQHEQQGMGIGLTIALLLVQLEGGALSIESAVGQGAAISLTFPCETDEPSSERTECAVELQAEEPESGAALPDASYVVAKNLIPPREQLERLWEAATIGDILAVRAQLDEVNAIDSHYAPFVERLYLLAQDFDVNAIQRVLTLYLPTGANV